MERKQLKQFIRLAALLLLAAFLAGCTATPDTTTNTQNGTGEQPPFKILGGTATPTTGPEESQSPSGTGPLINLPTGSDTIPQSTTPGAWGSVLVPSGQPGFNTPTPTPTVWGGVVVSMAPTTAIPAPTPVVLKLGATGPEVKAMQQRLKDLKYDVGSVDGDFGKSTEAALKAFQARNSLRVDGIAGSETLRKLNSSSALPPRPTPTPTPRATATPVIRKDVYLKLGSTGSDVRKMQERLIALGYLSGTANGQFDSITEAAVIAFQNRNTSYSDGIAGQLTLEKLYSSSARGTSTSVGIIGTSIKRGDSNSDMVRRIQRRLKELRYYTGSIDGDFGASTEAAVKAFQSANRLVPDGKVGPDTYEVLFSNNAKGPGATATPPPGQPGGQPTRIPHYTNVTPNPDGDYVTLREGDSGTLVRTLQQALKDQGFYKGDVDGKFGFGTTEAVKAFQRSRGLTPDGIAGQGTQRYLYQGNFPAGS